MKDAWRRQRELKATYHELEVPSINELDRMISNIEFGNSDRLRQSLQARALVGLYYLTACRCSEVIRCKILIRRKTFKQGEIKVIPFNCIKLTKDYVNTKDLHVIEWQIKDEFVGIKKEDITFDLIDERDVMYIRTLNRKNKNRKTKRQPIPINLELPIARHLKAYLDIVPNNGLLFNFGTKRATQIINQTIGFNIHFLRHIRATHLITLYDFNEQALIEFMGWSDARPAKHYMELSKKDLFRQFYKNIKEEKTNGLKI